MKTLIKFRNYAIFSFWVIFTGIFASQVIWLQSQPINSHQNQVLGTTDDERFYKVERIIDGDTIRVTIDGRSVLVRFIGINAPEIEHSNETAECFGYNSKFYLQSLIANSSVRLESDPNDSNKDKYGRLLRYVYPEDGTILNEKLVREGYAFAVVYNKGNRYERLLKSAQMDAQQNKVGYWGATDCH